MGPNEAYTMCRWTLPNGSKSACTAANNNNNNNNGMLRYISTNTKYPRLENLYKMITRRSSTQDGTSYIKKNRNWTLH